MRIAVAMSGGVDSSVTAAILKNAGHDVVGLHLRLYDHYESQPGLCCGIKDMNDGRAVADRLDIPYVVKNMRLSFEKAVVNNFVDEYLNGRTPNPCTVCNGRIKFGAMMKIVEELNCDYVATGHYATVKNGNLYRGVDNSKDQTYFLHTIPKQMLKKILMPMGTMLKTEVRNIAESLGLKVADKPDSQEICFVPNGHDKLIKLLRPNVDATGNIVDLNGNVLGTHDGYYKFTIGQRKGLGVGGLNEPHYVYDINPENNTVIIATRDKFNTSTLRLGRFNWLIDKPKSGSYQFRYRSNGNLIDCNLNIEGRKVFLNFPEIKDKIAPGQSAVIYNQNHCIGGGYVEKIS